MDRQKKLCSSSNQQQEKPTSHSTHRRPSQCEAQQDTKGRPSQQNLDQDGYNKCVHFCQKSCAPQESRPSQQNLDQDGSNKCVHFCQKSCAPQGTRSNSSVNRSTNTASYQASSKIPQRQNCSPTNRCSQTSRQSSEVSGSRRSTTSMTDSTTCNCEKCRMPGHPCDCPKCQAKKGAHSPNSSTSRSSQSTRQAVSCETSTDQFVPLLSSSQTFQDSNNRGKETYRADSQCDETNENGYSKNSTSSGTSRSMQQHRQSTENTVNDPTACNCKKCREPGHPCDCPKCAAKKEHSQNLETMRSAQPPRQSVCRNESTDIFASTPKFSESSERREKETYHPISPAQRSSVEKGQYSSTNTACSQGNTYKIDERPSTSTRMSGNTSLSPETRRSLMSTELNKSLFHPNSHDKLNKTPFGSIDQLYSPKDNESLLIEDTYNPGLIEDCVVGRKDFNAVSFGMFFENTQQIPKTMPEKTPMTLLEAIYKRIEVEREHMSDALNIQSNSQPLDVESIDLYFSCKPQTELNMALASLYKAESLYDEATKQGGNKSSSMSKEEASYDIEVQQTELPLVGGCPITVECYTGTTKIKQSSSKRNSSKADKNDIYAKRKR